MVVRVKGRMHMLKHPEPSCDRNLADFVLVLVPVLTIRDPRSATHLP
jgi:hypothetical protein